MRLLKTVEADINRTRVSVTLCVPSYLPSTYPSPLSIVDVCTPYTWSHVAKHGKNVLLVMTAAMVE